LDELEISFDYFREAVGDVALDCLWVEIAWEYPDLEGGRGTDFLLMFFFDCDVVFMGLDVFWVKFLFFQCTSLTYLLST
jgi:hypothetical protein